MKLRPSIALLALLALLPFAQAQPIPPPGLREVTHDATLTGKGTIAAPLSVVGGGGGADGDKGDVTVSSSGAVWTIDAAAVTLAKMADLAQARIIGRAAGAGTGAPTSLTGAQVYAIAIGDADKGDITTSSSGATWTIDNGAVTLAKLANIATARFLGRLTAGTGVVEELTSAQVTANLDLATNTTRGLINPIPNSSPQFLNGFNAWAVPQGTTYTQTCAAGQHVATLGPGTGNVGASTCTADAGYASSTSTVSVSGNQNDWAPAGYTANVTTTISFSTTSGAFVLTGLTATGAINGTRVNLRNDGSNLWTIQFNNGSSTAANRFAGSLGGDLVIDSGDTVELEYSGAFTRWVVLGRSRYMPQAIVHGPLSAQGTTLNSAATNASTFLTTGVTIQAGCASCSVIIGSIGTGGVVLGNAAMPVTTNGQLRTVVGAALDGDHQVALGGKLSSKSTGGLTVSSCGTGPTYVGDRTAYTLTTGTSATACTVTYTTPFVGSPTCVVSPRGSAKNYGYTITNSTLVIGAISGVLVFDVMCVDHY